MIFRIYKWFVGVGVTTKLVLISILLYFSLSVYGKENLSRHHWVYFKDKACTEYLLSQPEKLLTQKSIERRWKHGFSIDERDLPVCGIYVNELERAGYKIISKSKWLNAVVVAIENKDVLNFDFIKKIEPCTKYLIDQSFDANNVQRNSIGSNQKTESVYGATAPQLNMLNSACLHNDNFWGKGIDIAIFDAGFKNADRMEAFQHIFEDDRVLSVYDFVEKDQTVFEDEDSPHGTSVWSVMGAKITNEYVGAAPDANYHLLKTEDISSETLAEEYNWVAAVEYADSVGADIINSSLGYSLFDDSLQNHIYADMDGNTTPISVAADIAAAKGIVVVTSAGNSGTKDWTYITAPADADSILSVGSVDINLNKSSFSSFGPSADGDIKPEVAAMGSKTIVVNTDGTFKEAYGTSVASPLIAGMTACLWQKFPQETNIEIMNLVKRASSQYIQPDTLIGYGIPDFCNASIATGELEAEDLVVIYPSPFSNTLYLTFFNEINADGTHAVELFSINGKLVDKKQLKANLSESQTIIFSNLIHLPRGLYLVKYQFDNSIHHYKILKSN